MDLHAAGMIRTLLDTLDYDPYTTVTDRFAWRGDDQYQQLLGPAGLQIHG